MNKPSRFQAAIIYNEMVAQKVITSTPEDSVTEPTARSMAADLFCAPRYVATTATATEKPNSYQKTNYGEAAKYLRNLADALDPPEAT